MPYDFKNIHYAAVVNTRPTNNNIVVATSLPPGMEMYIEADTALVNHRDTRAKVTRFEVTSSWYRRWRKIERSLSTAMAVIFRNVAKPGRAIEK